MKGRWKVLGEGRVLKVTILETNYEANVEFPRARGRGGGGGGQQNKKPSMDKWIFSVTAHYGKQLQLIAATGVVSSGQV